jgi:hypothetical protein
MDCDPTFTGQLTIMTQSIIVCIVQTRIHVHPIFVRVGQRGRRPEAGDSRMLNQTETKLLRSILSAPMRKWVGQAVMEGRAWAIWIACADYGGFGGLACE